MELIAILSHRAQQNPSPITGAPWVWMDWLIDQLIDEGGWQYTHDHSSGVPIF